MGLSLVPVVGGAFQVIFTEVAGRRLQDRRDSWFNGLAAAVAEHEGRIGSIEDLVSQDRFMDALTTASQIADRTSRAEKLALLRNAVVNSVMPDAPDDDTQQLFFDLLDRFTPTHVRLLSLLNNPPGWFDRHGIAQPTTTMGSKTVIIEAGMPELAGRKDLIDRYAGALTNAGLINQAIGGIMTQNGIWAKATTSLGSEFLAFVANPQSATA
jgi:hypothetical protein